jgi:hypothetical protein
MDDLSSRLRAVCNLQVADVREYSGRHEYDGKVQDLSVMGVRRGLTDLASVVGEQPLADPYDEAQLQAFIRRTQVEYRDLELHRSNPAYHLFNLDLACYTATTRRRPSGTRPAGSTSPPGRWRSTGRRRPWTALTPR